MNCILIETSAYADLQAHIQRLLERVSALQALTEKSPTVRWLTADDVCKALSITKRALQYYRSCAGHIPKFRAFRKDSPPEAMFFHLATTMKRVNFSVVPTPVHSPL